MFFRRHHFRSGWIVLLVTGLLMLPSPVQAQDAGLDSLAEGRGTVQLVDWPDVPLEQLLDEMGRRAPRLLPEIDRLTLDYGYVAGQATSDWSFEIAWRPGNSLLESGRVKPWREAPPDVRMVSVELLADVVVRGDPVAQMIVAVDSMRLRAAPNSYTFDVTVGHDRVFLNTDSDEAREFLKSGATLDNVVVERMGFAAFGRTETGDARTPRESPRRDPGPETSIYEPRTAILIGWRIGPNPYYVGPRRTDGAREDARRRPDVQGRDATGTADTRPNRGDAVDREEAARGQGDAGRDESGRRTGGREGDESTADRGDREGRSGDKTAKRGGSGKPSDDDDDDDDEPNLAVPALGAAAAVGLAAYAGGTVGVVGTGDSPIGLAAGYTHPSGGVQLQASVNTAVIAQEESQKLTVKALGFYDVLASRVQPAIGLGVQVDTGGGDDIEPAVSAGLVGNLGRFVLYGGYDVAQNVPEVGIAYNFRYQSTDPADDAIAGR